MINLNSYPQLYAEAFKNLDFDKVTLQGFVSQCPSGKILELGGGSGRTIGFFPDRIHVLLESDSEMLDILKLRSNNRAQIEIMDGTCPLIPSTDKSFAGVFAAFGTMGEINPLCITLSEIRRVIKDDGLVYLAVMNPEYYKTAPLGLNRNKTLDLKEFTIITNTIPVHALGEGEFQTHVWARSESQSSRFVIKQYFPSIAKWFILFSELGFNIFNDIEIANREQVVNFVLQKSIQKNNFSENGNVVEEYYNSIALDYKFNLRSTKYGLHNWIDKYLVKLSGLNPTVLDLACGSGLVGELIHNYQIKPYRLYGYDISENMVSESLKSNYYNSVVKFDLSKGLPGVAGLNIDLVTSFGFLEFLFDILPLLKDIRRVLILGGEFWCSFEASDDESDISIIETNFKTSTIFRYKRSENYIKKAFVDAGFGELAIEKSIGYISPTTGKKVDYFYVCAKKLEI